MRWLGWRGFVGRLAEYGPATHVVAALIAEQCPQFSSLPINRFQSSGTDHWLYRLGEEYVLRLPKREEAVRQADREHRFLKRFTNLPLATPDIVFKGTPTLTLPNRWSIMRWIEGDDATRAPVTDWAYAALRLGSFVAAMRRCDASDAPPAGPDNAWRGMPLATLDARVARGIAALSADYDCGTLSEIWNRARSAPQWDAAAVWVHGDLHAANIVVHEGRIAGVVDFGLIAVGDPAVDLMPGWSVIPKTERAHFRKAAEVDEATWERGMGWALYVGVVALPFHRITNPALAKIARGMIDAVLGDDA
jgi:aminoglycoside phosphotransferase (APT) family kinase protein